MTSRFFLYMLHAYKWELCRSSAHFGLRRHLEWYLAPLESESDLPNFLLQTSHT